MARSLQSNDKKLPPWMVVYVTNNPQEAHIVAGRLEHEGIKTIVHQEAGASAIGISVGLLGEVKVLVSAADYDAALDILYPEDMPELDDGAVIYDDEDDPYDDDE